MKILVVGSNPSTSSPDNTPFHPNTKSRQVFDSWTAGLDIKPVFINICDIPTVDNKAINLKEVDLSILAMKIAAHYTAPIITLGKVADEAVSACHFEHLAMPHPSGLNRKLNDPAYIHEMVHALCEYIKGYNPHGVGSS